MISDRLERWTTHFTAEPWPLVFRFLSSLDAGAADVDRIELDGGRVYARVMTYPTRPREEATIEAHDGYIDVQMSLRGTERIDVFDRGRLTERVPYDPAKDVVLFERPALEAVSVINDPGRFTVLYPWDAHMPQLGVGDERAPVSKAVVKVSVALVKPGV